MEYIVRSTFLKDDAKSRILRYGLMSNTQKKLVIKNNHPRAKEIAAIQIQRVWRGYRVRKRIGKFLNYIGKQLSSFGPISAVDYDISNTLYTGSGSKELNDRLFDISNAKSGESGLNLLGAPASNLQFTKPSPVCSSSGISNENQVDNEQTKEHGESGSSYLDVTDVGISRERVALIEDTVPAKRMKMTKKAEGRLALEASYDRYVQEALKKGVDSTEMMPFQDYCAHRIQIWWLMKHRQFLRKRFIQRLVDLQKKAALQSAADMEAKIMEASKVKPAIKKKRSGPPTEREAAISIQRAWRRHIDIQVYRYYRDLINFKNRGDPSVMLRCINPNEAKLLEPGSGTSVRFRLAGDRFPPNIYYKIFTHRPIQDMCAYSPKDYTRPEAKQLNVRHRHNDVAKLPPQEDENKHHWYKRFENNGWRLVSDRLIHHIMNDPITWESARKTYHFDHSKLKRKQDVEKQKKTKKIEWMKKMYKDGMLRARADDPETVQLIEGAAAGMIATVENQGTEALEDWEVDELLDWTTSLNFEEYFSAWKDIATSAPADCQKGQAMNIHTSNVDPYELTVSSAPSRFQSTRQSRHTPATLSGSIHIRT